MTETEIDAVVRAVMDAEGAPGAAVAVVKKGEIVYCAGYGRRERDDKTPVTPDTQFAIASTTKAFTTAALAMLVDDGKLGWDDPVRTHLPTFRLSDPLADAAVTVRDLVCHRTGMPRHDMLWYGSPWDRHEVLRRFGLAKPTQTFRALYQYNNICFLAAGQVIAAASGMDSWEAFVRERIFTPLGIDAANFDVAHAQAAPDHATPHRKKKNKIGAIPWRGLNNCAPGGAINAGAGDMARWLRLQTGGGTVAGKTLVSAANLAETHTPQMIVRLDDATRALYPETTQMSYGLGWSIWDYRGGHKILSHGGALDGFRSQAALVPELDLGIAVLTNLGPTWLPEAVRNALIDGFLGLPNANWIERFQDRQKIADAEQSKKDKADRAARRKNTKPSLDLADYAGTYAEPAYGAATVTHKKETLTLSWSTLTLRLKHWHFDTFTLTGDELAEGQKITFHLGADGRPSRLTLLDQEFGRV